MFKYKSYLIIFLFLTFGLNAKFSLIDRTQIKSGTFKPEKELLQLLKRIQIPIDTISGRPILQKYYLSTNGHFKVHYNTSGYHKVSGIDDNSNGIPDYIDSVAFYFEYVYDVYINQMGYITPPIDDSLGSDNRYDIYLMNIGDGYPAFYGVTRKDFEIQPRVNFPKFATHIIMDNDYSPYDSTDVFGEQMQTFDLFGIPLVKITAAHEFHHAIQLHYGNENSVLNTHIINEMTSTYMEYRIFPFIKDYLQYVSMLCYNSSEYPFGYGLETNGYYWAILGQYFNKKYGDRLLIRTWEMIGDGLNNYLALDSALKEEGSDLPSAFCEFSDWMYYTGSRTSLKSYFEDAVLLPDFKASTNRNYIEPAILINKSSEPFQISLYEVIFRPQENQSLDTLNMMVCNTDIIGASLQNNSNIEYELSISSINETGSKEIEDSGYFYKFSSNRKELCERLYYNLTEAVSYSYPSPFRPSENHTLFLPVDASMKLTTDVTVNIYSSDYLLLKSLNKIIEKGESLKNENRIFRCVKLQNFELKEFNSGVYFYSIENKEKSIFGKFAIMK